MREQARRHGGTKARSGIALLVLAACAALAFWPSKPTAIETPIIERAESIPKQTASLDLAAFRAPIWVAEPTPTAPAAAARAPPPPPLKLQLLAIIRESETYRAAVYDPDSDRILVVAAGERLGTRTVEQVDKASLTLRNEAGRRVLALKEGGSP